MEYYLLNDNYNDNNNNNNDDDNNDNNADDDNDNNNNNNTVIETLPVSAKSLPILPPDYWHPPQSNFTKYKQDVEAVFYAPVNGQWVH